MVGKRGGYNVQRLLGNRQIYERIQILPAAGDLAPDLSDSLFNLVPVYYLIDHTDNCYLSEIQLSANTFRYMIYI